MAACPGPGGLKSVFLGGLDNDETVIYEIIYGYDTLLAIYFFYVSLITCVITVNGQAMLMYLQYVGIL